MTAGALSYGLIGYPVKHSLSPAMHNAAFRELGINASYRLFEIPPQDIPAFLLDANYSFRDTQGVSVRTAELAGFNVTIPHKIAVKEILQKEYPAQTIKDEELYYLKVSGAINTVKKQPDGIMIYRNTDVLGFLASLKEDLVFFPQGKDVLVIGCGGAGRAIIAALTWKANRANKIYIFENNPRSRENAREHFSAYGINEEIITFVAEDDLASALAGCALLVNASPVGMKEGDAGPIKKEWLKKNLSVYDIVYNRPTRLLRDARELGLNASGGLGMLLYQGAEAFEFWTSRKAPVEIMRNALREAAGL